MDNSNQWQYMGHAGLQSNESLNGYVPMPIGFESNPCGVDGCALSSEMEDLDHFTSGSNWNQLDVVSPDIAWPEIPHPSFVDSYAQSSGIVKTRRSSDGHIKKEPRSKLSTSSGDTDISLDDDHQVRTCAECRRTFESLQKLDHHTKTTSHKAWKCTEPGCSKTYARRDTYSRHRMTHKEYRHFCLECQKDNKQKVFKRKDHLKEHIRNCHFKGVDARSNNFSRFVGVPCDSKNTN